MKGRISGDLSCCCFSGVYPAIQQMEMELGKNWGEIRPGEAQGGPGKYIREKTLNTLKNGKGFKKEIVST